MVKTRVDAYVALFLCVEAHVTLKAALRPTSGGSVAYEHEVCKVAVGQAGRKDVSNDMSWLLILAGLFHKGGKE
jgi:hypothetical protein